MHVAKGLIPCPPAGAHPMHTPMITMTDNKLGYTAEANSFRPDEF